MTVATVRERDSAAKSRLEVFPCYSGLHAVWFYRINHWLRNRGFWLLARWLSQVARFLTGIEIQSRVRVTLNPGVTLGGTGKEHGKRHPTIEDEVVIGGGAKVLGNITVGRNCRIGAGSVVLRNVPENRRTSITRFRFLGG